MVSSSTCTTPPIASCAPRVMLRSRRESTFTNHAIAGPTRSAMRVSFQFRYRSHASSPTIVIVSFTTTVTTLVAAAVTPDTS